MTRRRAALTASLAVFTAAVTAMVLQPTSPPTIPTLSPIATAEAQTVSDAPAAARSKAKVAALADLAPLQPVWQHPLPGSCRPPRGDGVFGAPRDGGTRTHKGVDLGNSFTGWQPVGTPVRSIGGGVVEYAGWNGGAGQQVRIVIGQGSPDAVTYKVHHLDSIWVRVGQWVAPGQAVGGLGNTGNSTGPHAHVELHQHGEAHDPVTWLRGVGVELGCGR